MFKETPVSPLLTREVVTVQTFNTEVWEKLIKKNYWIHFLFLGIKWQFGKRKKGQACGPTLWRGREGLTEVSHFSARPQVSWDSVPSVAAPQRGHSVCTWATGTFPVTRRPPCFPPLVLPHFVLINAIKSTLPQYSSRSDIWRQSCVCFPLG